MLKQVYKMFFRERCNGDNMFGLCVLQLVVVKQSFNGAFRFPGLLLFLE